MFTGMHQKKIYYVWFVGTMVWSIRGMAHSSADISEKTFRFHRSAKLFFDYAVNKLSIKRLQIMVCSIMFWLFVGQRYVTLKLRVLLNSGGL